MNKNIIFLTFLNFLCFAINTLYAQPIFTLGVTSGPSGFIATADSTKSISGVLIYNDYTNSNCTESSEINEFPLTNFHNIAFYTTPFTINGGSSTSVNAIALYSNFWNELAAQSIESTPQAQAPSLGGTYATIMMIQTYTAGPGYAVDFTTPPSNYALYNTTGGTNSTCVQISCNDTTRTCNVTPTVGSTLSF
jgi:hypothetical protein